MPGSPAVNYAPDRGQFFARLPFGGLRGRSWRLADRLGDARYDRDGDDLGSRGLSLDMAPWQYHLFEMTAI